MNHEIETPDEANEELQQLLTFCALGDELLEEERNETLYDVDEGSVLEGTGVPAHLWPEHD